MAEAFDAWDAEDFDPEVGFSKPAEGEETWEGEDEGLVIEQGTVEEVKAKSAVATKKTKHERIEEKKAKRREEEVKKQLVEKTPPPLSEKELREERERQEEAQRKADLQSAIELFGGPKSSAVSGSSSIDHMNPSSMEEFEEFQKALNKKIIQFEGSTHFYLFLESLIRSVCVPLDVEDLRRLSSMLGVMANEKQKMKQPHQKKKKAKGVLGNVGKASKRLERDTFDDDLGADFDDFM